MKSVRILSSVFFVLLVVSTALLAMEGSPKMESLSEPRGVLYVIENKGLYRFDFMTKTKQRIFEEQFQKSLQIDHLSYFEKSNRLVVFDSGEETFLSKEGRFVGLNPKTKEMIVFLLSSRKYGLNTVAYSPDEKRFAVIRPKHGKAKLDSEGRPGREPFELWTQEFASKEEIRLEDNAWFSQLWISKNLLLYLNFSEELMQINIDTKEKTKWGLTNIYPQALSPDGSKILATDRDRSKIYLIDVVTKSLKLVKEYSWHGLYGPTVWSPDGKSFIYNRRDARDHLLPQYLIGETPWRLYWYDLETGREKRISANPWWKKPSEDVWLYSGAVWFAEDPFQ